MVEDTFDCLIKNKTPVPEHITALTGIDDRLLSENGTDVGDALRKMLVFVGTLPIICYSKAFDRAFINKAAEEVDVDVSKLRFYNAHGRIKSKMPGLEDYKLLTVAKVLGVSEDQKHRALEDSLMLYDILFKLKKTTIRDLKKSCKSKLFLVFSPRVWG